MAENAQKFLDTLKSGVNIPLLSGQISTLGGEENISILLLVCFQKKEDWENGPLEDGKFARLQVFNDGNVEFFSRYGSAKLHECSYENAKDLAEKLNKWILV